MDHLELNLYHQERYQYTLRGILTRHKRVYTNVFFAAVLSYISFPIITQIKSNSTNGFRKDIFCSIFGEFNFYIFSIFGAIFAYKFNLSQVKATCSLAILYIFIPMFLFCNYQPLKSTRQLLVLFNDYCFVVFVSLFSFCLSFIISNSVLYIPRTFEDYERERGGLISGAIILSGAAVGMYYSLLNTTFI